MSTCAQRTSYLVPQAAAAARTDDAHWAHAFARIENHFFVHGELPLHTHLNTLLNHTEWHRISRRSGCSGSFNFMDKT
jgi:hypothetical protein